MTARRIVALLACLAAGCEEAPKPIAPVAESGELVVLTVNGPATYFEDAQGLPSGLEYDLATLFAKELKARPTFVLIDNPAKIDRVLRQGQAHLAAAALARHFDFPGGLAWGPSYHNTQHQIVCRVGETKAKKLEDLAGKRIGVIEESVADYLLTDPPKLDVPIERLPPGTSTADLLEQVAKDKLDCALVESTRYTLARRFFPQLEVAFNVGKPVDYAWLVSTVDKKRILEAAVPFFERIRKDGTLKRLIDRYYGHALRFSAIDAGAFLEQIATQLPKLKPHFQDAERVSGVDWRLIAAIGYQESHWDAKATSPTGVRGLMMLTEETAGPPADQGPPRRAREHPRRRALLRAAEGSAAPAPARARPHLPRARRLQHRHRAPRGRAHPRAEGEPQPGQVAGRAAGDLEARRARVVPVAQARLRARRRGDAARRQHPQLLRHPRAHGAARRAMLPPAADPQASSKGSAPGK